MTDIARTNLESAALTAAPADHYWELLDVVDELPEETLHAMVDGDWEWD